MARATIDSMVASTGSELRRPGFESLCELGKPGVTHKTRNTQFIHSDSFFKKYFIYLFMRNTERGAETQAEGEAGTLQRARCGTQTRDPGIMTGVEGKCSTTEPPRCP